MNEANFEFNLNQQNPWTGLSAGAKVATILAGLAIAAASLAASIFLAGAALFAGAVFVTYQWISDRFGKADRNDSIIEAEYAEVETKSPGS